MSSPRRLVVSVLVPLWAVSLGVAARAQAPEPATGTEAIDDPKLARRLGTRVELPPGSEPAPGPPEGTAAVAGGRPSATPEPAVTPPDAGGALALDSAAPSEDGPDLAATAPPPEPADEGKEQRLTPRLKLGYRRFTFAQIGAPGSSGPAASEPFDVVSVDLYPVSSAVRFGLTGQYGWQEGTFRQNGDAFFAGAVSLGWQLPGPVFTPFLEGFGGVGVMQRTKSDLGLNSIATLYGQYGTDLGTEVFLARNFCMSFAIGWVHLANGFARKAFDSFSVDTWSFKLGVGL